MTGERNIGEDSGAAARTGTPAPTGSEGWTAAAAKEVKGRDLTCFFFNDTATTEIYTAVIVGSVRCV